MKFRNACVYISYDLTSAPRSVQRLRYASQVREVDAIIVRHRIFPAHARKVVTKCAVSRAARCPLCTFPASQMPLPSRRRTSDDVKPPSERSVPNVGAYSSRTACDTHIRRGRSATRAGPRPGSIEAATNDSFISDQERPSGGTLIVSTRSVIFTHDGTPSRKDNHRRRRSPPQKTRRHSSPQLLLSQTCAIRPNNAIADAGSAGNPPIYTALSSNG